MSPEEFCKENLKILCQELVNYWDAPEEYYPNLEELIRMQNRSCRFRDISGAINLIIERAVNSIADELK